MSGTSHPRIAQLAERIDMMTLRERALIFFSLMAILFFAANGLVLTPIFKNNQRQEQALSARIQQVQQLDEQMQSVLKADKNDADAEQSIRLRNLRNQLAEHDPTRQGSQRSLIPPTEMVALVEQMLTRNHALQIIHVENLPPELLDAPPADKATAASAPATGIFRHGMQIELRGRYIDIVNYLRELEALPWKIYWGRFTLTTEDYPNSRMTLVIYTLSLQSGWVGT